MSARPTEKHSRWLGITQRIWDTIGRNLEPLVLEIARLKPLSQYLSHCVRLGHYFQVPLIFPSHRVNIILYRHVPLTKIVDPHDHIDFF